MITADEVQALVRDQIGDTHDETNAHGISAAGSLVYPVQVEITYPTFRDGKSVDYRQPVWLISEEREDGSGYKVVYDEELQSFGLATPGKARRPALVVSNYKTFLDAFKGM